MASFFITASNRWAALYWKETLQRFGQVVRSTWHDSPMVRTSELITSQKEEMCESSYYEISASKYLLVLSDPDMVPGGKFVDVGIALGFGIKVIVVGRRENLKMNHPSIRSIETMEDLHKLLVEYAESPLPCCSK